MLDVHPPHTASHTWNDFFIHVGTICVGLLIAIGLEQTVEYFHHLHQRHELERELRAEGLRNKASLEAAFTYQDVLRRLELDQKSYYDQLLALHTRTLPRPPEIDADADYLNSHNSLQPSTTAWDTARESQMVALLPAEEAAAYARLYLRLNLAFTRRQEGNEATARLGDFIARFEDRRGNVRSPAYARMTDAQLDELSALEAAASERIRIYKAFLVYAYGHNEAMLNSTPDHPPTEEEMMDAELKAVHAIKTDLGTDPYTDSKPAK